MSEYLNQAKEFFQGGYYEKLLSVEDKNLEDTEEERAQVLNEIFTRIDKFIKEKGNAITASQLRNIFSRVKRAQGISELVLLRPKLAYISARQRNRDARVITDFISQLIIDINKETSEKKPEAKKSMVTIMEAMVAYHKFHHDKKS